MLFCSRFHGIRDWLFSNCWIWVLTGFLCATCIGGAQQASYSIQVQPGYNSIANHLVNGANKLNDILRNVPDDSELFKFNPATQEYYGGARFSRGLGWSFQEPEMEYLNPGEGAFIFVHQPTNVTFSGTLPQFPLPRQAVLGGLNFVSGHEPRTMTFAELFGFPPQDGDEVYLYDQPLPALPQPTQQSPSSTHKFLRQGWDRVPSFKRGRSAFVFLSRGPRIIQHPKSQITSTGQILRLEVSLLGNAPFSYQWHFNDDEIAGETNSVLVLNNVRYLQSGLYSVTVRNPFGETTSKHASIRVDSPPVILDPPRPARTIPGQTVQLRVRAVGTPTLRYQWFRNNQTIPNATEAVLNVSNTPTALYHVRVMNGLGFDESSPIVVEVNDPVIIVEHPASVTVPAHERATFNVIAKGTPPLRYQWRRNGENLKNETNATLVISDAHPTNSGLYQVTVGNVMGAIDSKLAELKVQVAFDIVLTNRIEDSILYEMLAFTGRGHNFGATNEKDEFHCKRVGGSSVWLKWKTKVRGIVHFETSGSTFDTVIAAYTMSREGALTEVVCDDDEGEFYGSRIEFAATPDVTYFIAIDGLDGAQGQILLDWELKPTLETLPVILEQPRDQTVPLGGQATFTVLPTENPTGYIWYHDGVEVPGQNGPRLIVERVERDDLGTYYVEVYQDNRFVRSRRVLLQVSLADMDTRLLDAFAVDKFADALDRRSTGSLHSVSGTAFTPALGYTGTQIFSTISFRGEPGELSHCGIPGGSSAWFSFIPAADGQLHLNTLGSTYDTVLAVYTGPGPTIASLTALVCDNDSGPGTTSSLNFPATEGTVYYIAVDGYNGVTGSAQLNYRLLVPMTLTDMTKTNDIACSLRVTATPSYPFTIQRCSGFQVWTPVLTNSSPTGTYDYRDTNATPSRRFYRARQTP